MDNTQATRTGNIGAGAGTVASCTCCGGKGPCLICVAAELEQVRTRDSERGRHVVQLECALLTSRAEAVLLRRLLALAEHMRSEDLVTLAQIEEACAMRGYEPSRGQSVALWLAAALESRA